MCSWHTCWWGPQDFKSLSNYVLNLYSTIFIGFMQNIYAISYKMLQSFKTSEEIFPDIYAILHKLLSNEKAKEILTSAACTHFGKWEKIGHFIIYALLIWIQEPPYTVQSQEKNPSYILQNNMDWRILIRQMSFIFIF